jgi:hypothetical protein
MSAQVGHNFIAASAEDAWARAYKEAVTRPAWEQAEWLLETIGPRFTAAAVGVKDARTVKRWRDERVEPRDQLEHARLELLYRITYAIVAVYGAGSVAAGFLRSANPQLDDEAPLVVLATGDPKETQRPILAGTRAFLEG